MSETAALAILIDAPLQAWGVSSRYQRRETESFPVKSGLVGLLAAALGIDKHALAEDERIKPLTLLRSTVYRVPKKSSVSRLVDFHTVGGGYDKDASTFEKLSIPRKASGPPFGTVITRRTYLTDARFAAVFAGDAATIREAALALTNPVWGVWFGRKACLPALPLSPVVAASSEAVLAALLSRLAEWEGGEAHDPTTLERWEEPESPDSAEGDFFLPDAPVSFGARSFTDRPVRHFRGVGASRPDLEPESDSEAFFDSIPGE